MKDASAKPLYDNTHLGNCPLCSHPIIEGRQGYGCSQWSTGCQFVLWKQSYGLIVTRDMACQLLQTGRTIASYPVVLNDTRFNAQLTLNNQGELSYHALQNKPALTIKDALGDCPLCQGKIIETSKAYSCSEWRSGCKVSA